MQDSDAIKLFVGQIPKHMEEEDLRPVFEEFGEIFDLAVIRDKISGLHRGKEMDPHPPFLGGNPESETTSPRGTAAY